METTIKRKLTGVQMEEMFDDRELINIRYFKSISKPNEVYQLANEYLFDIKIRHCEEEDPNVLFDDAFKLLTS